MPNLAYFEVPVEDLNRAKMFYRELLNWEFARAENPDIRMEYWMITTGPDEEGTINRGGMYQRPVPMTGIITYARVEDLDKALARVEKLGGRIIMPKMSIDMVGCMAHILDSEGNLIALWEPEQMGTAGKTKP
jgi:predicted enzyme related to lactoylglutathione lyase